MKRPMKVWPPSRNGYPTCPVCDEWITTDPGPRGVIVLPDDPLVGRYAHAACVLMTLRLRLAAVDGEAPAT